MRNYVIDVVDNKIAGKYSTLVVLQTRMMALHPGVYSITYQMQLNGVA